MLTYTVRHDEHGNIIEIEVRTTRPESSSPNAAARPTLGLLFRIRDEATTLDSFTNNGSTRSRIGVITEANDRVTLRAID